MAGAEATARDEYSPNVQRSVTILDIENDVLASHNYLVEMQAEVERAKQTYEGHLRRMADYQSKQVYGHEVAKIIPECRTVDKFDEAGDQ